MRRGRHIFWAAALWLLPFMAGTTEAAAQNLSGLPLAQLKIYAEQGNTEAQIKLGEQHYYGDGGAPSDNAEALRWFLMAAEAGDSVAQSWAGSLYRGTKGVTPDAEKAKFWFSKAIAQGSDAAAYNLSNLYKDEKNYAEALRLMKLYGELAGNQLYEDDRESLAREIAALENLMTLGSQTGDVFTLGPEPSAPGLLPGEFLQQTTNGCQIVSWLPATVETSFLQSAQENTVAWSGNCLNGRAHGRSKIFDTTPETEFAYGYLVSSPVSREQTGRIYRERYVVPGLGYGQIEQVPADAPFVPTWSPGNEPGVIALLMNASISPGERAVHFLTKTCSALDKDNMSDVQKRALSGKRCAGKEGDIQIYGIVAQYPVVEMVVRNSKVETTHTTKRQTHFCPDPKSSVGCQKIWNQEIASFLPSYRLLREVATHLEQQTAEREHIIAAWVDYEKKLEAWKQAKADMDKATADRARAQQAAAAEATRLEAEARKEAEQKELAASLKTLNPGQMLAKADELEQAGRIEDARTVRRELLSRFPDHPLAAIAAQKLSAAPSVQGGSVQMASGSPAPAAAPVVSGAAGAASNPGRSCESYLNETIEPANAGSNAISYAQQLELTVHLRHFWLQMAAQMPVCQQDTAFLATMRSRLPEVQQQCRSGGGSRCDTGSDMRAANFRQDLQSAAQRVIAAANAAGGTATATQAAAFPPGAQAGICRSVNDFERRFDQVRAQYPRRSDWGSRNELLYTAFIMQRGIEELQSCGSGMSRADYDANMNAMVTARDTSIRGCEQLSSTAGSCSPPTYP